MNTWLRPAGILVLATALSLVTAVVAPDVIPSAPGFAQASTADEGELPFLRGRLEALDRADQFTGVVLVARGDEVLLRQAYGMADRTVGQRNRIDSRFRLASVSKQFTAAAILKLQDEGHLGVDDLVCRWFQPCPQGWETMRIRHLLAHTSGIPDLMERPGWGDQRVAPATLAQLTADTLTYRPRFEPGTKADYDNAAYNLLAEIVQRASGQRFEDYLQTRFFGPLEMNDTGSDADAAGHGIVRGYNQSASGPVPGPVANVSVIPGAGALYSTVDDLLKWQRALHHGRVLSDVAYAQMIADHAPADQGLPEGARPRGWGFGLFTSDLATGAVPEFHAPQIYHTGSWAGFRNMVSYAPDQDITVIVLTNNYHQRDQVFLITQQAMAEVLGQPFPTGLKE
jgi:Beta-lactamase class C and other penicillin binding proteins